MNSNWLLLVVLGYVIYKIGWVDGFTATNLLIVFCLALVGGVILFRHSARGKELIAKRDAAEKAYKEQRAQEKKKQ